MLSERNRVSETLKGWNRTIIYCSEGVSFVGYQYSLKLESCCFDLQSKTCLLDYWKAEDWMSTHIMPRRAVGILENVAAPGYVFCHFQHIQVRHSVFTWTTCAIVSLPVKSIVITSSVVAIIINFQKGVIDATAWNEDSPKVVESWSPGTEILLHIVYRYSPSHNCGLLWGSKIGWTLSTTLPVMVSWFFFFILQNWNKNHFVIGFRSETFTKMLGNGSYSLSFTDVTVQFNSTLPRNGSTT